MLHQLTRRSDYHSRILKAYMYNIICSCSWLETDWCHITCKIVPDFKDERMHEMTALSQVYGLQPPASETHSFSCHFTTEEKHLCKKLQKLNNKQFL